MFFCQPALRTSSGRRKYWPGAGRRNDGKSKRGPAFKLLASCVLIEAFRISPRDALLYQRACWGEALASQRRLGKEGPSNPSLDGLKRRDSSALRWPNALQSPCLRASQAAKRP